jgi:single-stranded DNA-specific DHH superfamily exonuclease
MLEPMGEGNPEPVFELEAAIVRADVVGEHHLKLILRIGAREVSAFGFELGPRKSDLPAQVRVVGHVRPDTFRGGDTVEVRLLELGPL